MYWKGRGVVVEVEPLDGDCGNYAQRVFAFIPLDSSEAAAPPVFS
jgi:hypothetical protein